MVHWEWLLHLDWQQVCWQCLGRWSIFVWMSQRLISDVKWHNYTWKIFLCISYLKIILDTNILINIIGSTEQIVFSFMSKSIDQEATDPLQGCKPSILRQGALWAHIESWQDDQLFIAMDKTEVCPPSDLISIRRPINACAKLLQHAQQH